jgi:hypothetical protein
MNLNRFKSRPARLAMLGLAVIAVVLVVVVVATSGGSSTSTSTSRPASASAGAGTNDRTAFVQCMKEHGVTITPHAGANGAPAAHTGTPPAGTGSGSGNPTREAAFKACGGPGQRPNSQ